MSDVLVQQQNLEGQIKAAREHVARRDMALKLYNIREFKKIIIDEFCGTECARYVQASGDPALSVENRADSLAIAQASGHLRRYLSVLIQMGNQAAREIAECEQALEELRAEDQDETVA